MTVLRRRRPSRADDLGFPVIAGLRADRWTLPLRDVQNWLDQVREGEREMSTRASIGADGALAVSIGRAER